jgi:hypothetical protein
MHDAFLRFQKGRPWAPTLPHACTSACPLLHHRNIYVCVASGNYHFCTEMACDRAVEHADGRTCSLTNLLYPSAFQYTYEQGERSADQRRARDVSMRPIRTYGLSSSSPSPSPSPSPPSAHHYDMRRGQYEMDAMAVRQLVRKLLGARISDESSLERIQKQVFQSFYRIKPTAVFMAAQQRRYNLTAHIVTALYCMAQSGCVQGDRVLIYPDPEVRAAMPLIDDIDIAAGFNYRKHYKKLLGVLHACAQEWFKSSD